MEGNLLIVLAYMGALSLYIVIATIVGRGIYSATRSWGEDGRIAAATLGGALFPISVPISVAIVWVWSIVTVPMRMGEDQGTDVDEYSQELNVVRERVRTLERSDESASTPTPKPKTKFKAGDLITGIEGNPGGYKHLYAGCVCRVLEVDGKKAMKVLLVDHIDFNAQKEKIGKKFKAPQRYFTLIKPVVKKKAVSTKKVAKRK